MTNIIGIDVGKFGCLVSLSDVNKYLLMPMMEDKRDGVDLDIITPWLVGYDIKAGQQLSVCMEQQWTYGVEGRVSIAYLMLQYGQLKGLCNMFNCRIIPVSMWKKHHGVHTKEDAIALVGKMYPKLNWPKLKPHRHGLADAILIALYGQETQNERSYNGR